MIAVLRKNLIRAFVTYQPHSNLGISGIAIGHCLPGAVHNRWFPASGRDELGRDTRPRVLPPTHGFRCTGKAPAAQPIWHVNSYYGIMSLKSRHVNKALFTWRDFKDMIP